MRRRQSTDTRGFPERAYVGENVFYFDQIAPITGDAVYRRETDTGTVEHAIITNTQARTRQLSFFNRGG